MKAISFFPDEVAKKRSLDGQMAAACGWRLLWALSNEVLKSKLRCRRKFRSQISDLWTDAATVVRVLREEKELEEKVRTRCRKVAKHYVFPRFCGCGGSKSRLDKAAGAEPSGRRRDQKGHAAVAAVARSKF